MSIGLAMAELHVDERDALEWLMTSHTETPGPDNFNTLIMRGVTYADKIDPYISRLAFKLRGCHPTFDCALGHFAEYQRRRLTGVYDNAAPDEV